MGKVQLLPKSNPETAYGKDVRIVHQDVIDALRGIALLCEAAYVGGTETLVDYVQAKAYVVEKLDAMIKLLEQDRSD